MLNMVTVAAFAFGIVAAKIQYSALKSQQCVRIRFLRHGTTTSTRGADIPRGMSP
jgi:hypothetical protein